MSSFCTAKATHIFFSKKFQHICVSLGVNFNESLTNDVVSFEQLGPDLQVALILPTKFQVKLAFQVRRRCKVDFQGGSHDSNLGFLIGMILAMFDLQVTPILPAKFLVNRPFSSAEELQNSF